MLHIYDEDFPSAIQRQMKGRREQYLPTVIGIIAKHTIKI